MLFPLPSRFRKNAVYLSVWTDSLCGNTAVTVVRQVSGFSVTKLALSYTFGERLRTAYTRCIAYSANQDDG